MSFPTHFVSASPFTSGVPQEHRGRDLPSGEFRRRVSEDTARDRRTRWSMGWRRGELWLDTELWLETVSVAHESAIPILSFPTEVVPPGLAASRRRRETWARDRHARRSRASAMALSPVVALALATLQADGRQRGAALIEDPPSLTFRFDDGVLTALERSVPAPKHVQPKAEVMPKIAWHHATSVGTPDDGRLVDGTQLPVSGPDWVTWDPITDSSPNLPYRLYGNQHTIRTIITVIHAYRAAHPHAPRVVIGDVSFEHGGQMNDHLSHQNGLDVDVYFPRRDRRRLHRSTTALRKTC